MFSFDLRKEKWIPVKTLTGENIEVSLFDALLKAREYKRIDDQSPLVVASLHRFLLAVLHRALKGPTDIKQNVEWFKNGFPEKEIKNYLDKWGDRFDLFHTDYPFYQVRDLPEEFKKHWHILTSESGSGSTSALFNYNHRNNSNASDELINPSHIARRLLEHQSFSLGGLIKKIMDSQPGFPTSTSAIIISTGENLLQTYCLNLVPYNAKIIENDLPVWERDSSVMNLEYMKGKKKKNKAGKESDGGALEPIRGIANLYTWVFRSIKLLPEIINDQICIKNILYASGVNLKLNDNSISIPDPMVSYKHDKEKGLIRIGFDKDKALWRDFNSIAFGRNRNAPHIIDTSIELLERFNKSNTISLSVYGQSTNQGKVELYRNENFSIPKTLLNNDLIKEKIDYSLEISEETFKKLKKSSFDLLVFVSPNLRSKNDIKLTKIFKGVLRNPAKKEDQDISFARTAIHNLPSTITYWSTLESLFATFLSNFNSMSPEDNETWWLKKLKDTLHESWQQTCESVGITGDSIKAIAMAEKIIRKHFNYLDKLIKGDDNV